jgi:hypothetical protein
MVVADRVVAIDLESVAGQDTRVDRHHADGFLVSQRASEHGNHGDSHSFSGVDASSILAALPPGLGQAASALTSFASSFKRSNAEGVEGDQQDEDVKKEQEAAEGHYEHHNPEGVHGHGGDEYQDEAAAIAAMSSLSQTMQDQKPSGSRGKKESGPEAERARKDQHKEVERKRRELISNGITELAAIVPGCDAKGVNKTAIINAAVRYIQELKNNEASNIEKWTLEKLLMDQAMNDLNQHLEASRKQVARLRAELGIEGEPEEIDYQADLESGREQNGDNLDPSLQSAAREGAAANALSEVAAAAAAAAADASNASAEALAEAAVEQATEEKKAEGGRSRGRGRQEVVAEPTRSKRSRQS